MKKWFMIYLLAIIVFAATTPAKAEGIAKKELPEKFELMVTGTEAEIVTIGDVAYECTTKYYFVNGKEHINGNVDRCFPLSSSTTPDPGGEEPEPTGTSIQNGAILNFDFGEIPKHELKPFKNKPFKTIR